MGSKLDDLLPHSLGNGFGAGRGAELSEQRFDVEFDGVRRNPEEPRHLLVGHAVAESAEHLDFARREQNRWLLRERIEISRLWGRRMYPQPCCDGAKRGRPKPASRRA